MTLKSIYEQSTDYPIETDDEQDHKFNQSIILVVLAIIIFWFLVYICTSFVGKIFLVILTLLVIYYCIWLPSVVRLSINGNESSDEKRKKSNDSLTYTPTAIGSKTSNGTDTTLGNDISWYTPFANQVKEKFDEVILV